MSLSPLKTQNQRHLPDTGLNLKVFDGPDYFTSNVLQMRRQTMGQERRGESALWSPQPPTAKATGQMVLDSTLPRDATLGESRRFQDCKISMDMTVHEHRELLSPEPNSSSRPVVSPSTASRPRALAPLSSLPKQPKLKLAGHPSPPLMSLRFVAAGT